jgi:hypothetical protein
MKITITFGCDNAAFEDPHEVQTVLAQAFKNLTVIIFSGESGNRILRDTNGNTIGTVDVEVSE